MIEMENFINNISNNKEDMKIFIGQLAKYFSKPVSRPIYVENVGGILKFFKPKKNGGKKIIFSVNTHNHTKQTYVDEYGWIGINSNQSPISEEIKIFIRDKNIKELLV